MTLFDPGLQPERTELAWRRTSLALALGSLLSLRMLPVALDSIAWVVPGIVGLVCSGLVWHAARHRYDKVTGAVLADGDRAELPDGRLIAATAGFVLTTGIAGLAVVIGLGAGV